MKVWIYGKLINSSKVHELVELIKKCFDRDWNCVCTQSPPNVDDGREYELLVEISEKKLERRKLGWLPTEGGKRR